MSSITREASLLLAVCLFGLSKGFASSGDTDPVYLRYLDQCARTGCLQSSCISGCLIPPPPPPPEPTEDGQVPDSPPTPSAAEAAAAASARNVTAPNELALTRWDCYSECKYQSMVVRETERQGQAGDAYAPVKYYGKWPFKRELGLQEPASVAFSILNLLATLWGLSTFYSLVFGKLPRKKMGDKGPLFEYSGLFLFYGLVQANSWFWSAVFHGRDTYYTERLDYYSAITLVGTGFALAVIRTASLRVEAARVMVAAPVIAFLTTHMLYLENYAFDYGWNIIVCSVFGVVTLLLWIIWAGLARHPAALFVWISACGTGVSMLLELYDFPPVWGVFDAHSLWHAATVPLTLCWWTFIKEDAKWRTAKLLSRQPKKNK